MVRWAGLRWVLAGVLSLLLAAGAPALAAAAPSSGAAGHPGATTRGAPGSVTGDPGTPAGSGFGQGVMASIRAARAAGATGTALAEAVHEELVAEGSNAKGLAVAEAVYGDRTAASAGAAPFADLLQQAPWAASAVGALHQSGVIEGTSPTTFAPGSPVTLAELATMLSRLQAATASKPSDAAAGTPAWAQNGMAWAREQGVLTGEQGLGAPDGPLTRAQAVLMLINAAGLGPLASTLGNASISLNGTPPGWAHGAIALAIDLGILQGSTGGQLLAGQTLTRAQMAVLLARLAVLESQAAGAGSGG